MKGFVFVAVGDYGLRGLSADAVNFEQHETLRSPPLLTHAHFLKGTLLACGSAKYGTKLGVYRSKNGVEWDYHESEKLSRTHGGFILNDKVFLFLGISDRGLGSVPGLTWSTDGATWADEISLAHPSSSSGKVGPVMRVAAVGPDRIVAVGDFGRRMVSLDGMKWEDAEWHMKEPTKRLSLVTIAYGNGQYVAAGLHGLRVTSPDGFHWNEPIPGLEGEHINNIFFDGQQFVCVGLGANYLSADGKTWQRVPNHDAPPLVTYGKGRYVGFKWPARIFTSEDAIRWEQVSELKQDISGMAFGEING